MKKVVCLLVILSLCSCAAVKDSLDRYMEPTAAIVAGLCNTLGDVCELVAEPDCVIIARACTQGAIITPELIKTLQAIERSFRKVGYVEKTK